MQKSSSKQNTEQKSFVVVNMGFGFLGPFFALTRNEDVWEALVFSRPRCTFYASQCKTQRADKVNNFFYDPCMFYDAERCEKHEARRRGMFLRLSLYYVCNLHELHHYFILGYERNVLFHFNFVAFPRCGIDLWSRAYAECKLKSGANSSRELHTHMKTKVRNHSDTKGSRWKWN